MCIPETPFIGIKVTNLSNNINTVMITNPGTNPANDFVTVGGTPSGIFMLNPLSKHLAYITVDNKATIIATNKPFAPKNSNCNTFEAGTLTPSANVIPFPVKKLLIMLEVFAIGVIAKNENNAIIPAVPGSF